MKRQIKFRAWHDGRMYYSQDEFRDTQFMLTAGEILDRFETVMQFTGLRDRNGTEIYEGDIMAVSKTKWSNGTGKVIWNADRYLLMGKDWEHDLLYAKNNYIVIGNIYENETNN